MLISKGFAAAAHNRRYSVLIDTQHRLYRVPPQPAPEKLGAQTGGIIAGGPLPDKPRTQKAGPSLAAQIPLDGGAFTRRRPLVTFRRM